MNWIYRTWLRFTTWEHFLVYTKNGWKAFRIKDEKAAMQQAYTSRNDLIFCWWSDYFGWVSQTKYDIMEIHDRMRNNSNG